MAGAILSSVKPSCFSQDKNAMPQPVLTGFWSVLSVLSTKSGMPCCAHEGAVAKSASALLPMTAAHQRERASPVLTPHKFPPIEHSLSSASKSADTRAELSKDAHTSIAAPVVELQPAWTAPPVPSVIPQGRK